MDKACAETVVVTVPAAALDAQAPHHASAPPPQHDPASRMKRLRLAHAFGHCIRHAVLGVVAYGLVHAAHLEPRRHHGRELALLAAAYAVLAALVVLWLRRRMRLKLIDYPGGDERAWVRKAVKDVRIDLAVFVVFFGVAELVPTAMSVLVWCVLAIFAAPCVYVVSFCDDQYWRDKAALGNVDSDDAVEKIRPADEKV